MKLEPIVISVVLFAGAIVGMGLFYQGISGTYELTNGTSFQQIQSMNQSIMRLNSTLENLEEKTARISEFGLGWNTYLDATLAFVNVGTILLQLPGIVITTITNGMSFLTFMGVPSIVTLTIMTIIFIVFVFRVAAIVTKSDGI